MTELKCQQTYQELGAILQDFQLGWVFEKVEAKIHRGKTTQPEIYTEQERLLLLIEAVARLVVGAIDIEGALVDFLVEETERLQSPITLSFESGIPALTPEDEGLEARRPAIAELRQILKTLRQEAASKPMTLPMRYPEI
jgi:hypothetical protein